MQRSRLPVADVGLNGFGNLVLARKLQARGDGDGILNCLGGTVTGSRQESVSSVANLDHAGCGRSPCELRVAPEELKVDNRVGRCALDELFELGVPFVWARDFVETLDDFVGANVVAPGFGGVLVGLKFVSEIFE